MCVLVTEVNWQISAAVRNTSPSAISLKRRSSRPLAANTNMISAVADRTRARTSMMAPGGSAPQVGAVACGRVQLIQVGFRALARHHPVLGHHVGEGGADRVPHRLRAAHVDVPAGLEQPPDERALRADPGLDILAGPGPLARAGHVYVVQHALGREPPDLVPADIVLAARPDAVEQGR